MQNEIVINRVPGETRAALVERTGHMELHIERSRDRGVVGSVIKGRVTRVLPGMQAAFVDIGLEKAAFLYVGDYLEEDADVEADGDEEAPRPRRRRNGGSRGTPKIESVLREGQEIVVQVAKEPIGTKGARITSHVAIPGRHLVLTPWSQRVGVSRRIESDRERRRLREIARRLRPPDLGFIIRTAGESAREEDIAADIRYLTAVWDEIQARKAEVRAPAVLYREPDLPLRIIRDFATSETTRIVVDDPEVHRELQDFLERFVAEPRPELELYRGRTPIFDEFGIEKRIDANLGRKVWLKSGGYLIIDQSEALTAIDVNTGRFVGRSDLEETVLRTNLEAVKEVVFQLKFRNIGGLIIIDLIDMDEAENREKVYRALREELRHDKAKTNILKISELGLVEMTRKRTRENLVQVLCEPCPHCDSRGYVLSPESVTFKVLREMHKDLPRFAGRHVVLTVSRAVAEHLLGEARESLRAVEEEFGREIEIRVRPGLHTEQWEIEAAGGAAPVALDIPWLADRHPDAGRAGPEPRRRRRRGHREAEAAEIAEAETPERVTAEATTETEAPEAGAPAGAAAKAETDQATAAVGEGLEAGVTAPPEGRPTPPAGEATSPSGPPGAAAGDAAGSPGTPPAPRPAPPAPVAEVPVALDESSGSSILPPPERARPDDLDPPRAEDAGAVSREAAAAARNEAGPGSFPGAPEPGPPPAPAAGAEAARGAEAAPPDPPAEGEGKH